MAYYLGIDGGGTKTTCAVGDESSVLATAVAGPSNITRVGEDRARESLLQAINQACGAAGISPSRVKRACIGVAGAGREEVADLIRKIVAEVLPGETMVVGDMPIALEAAFGNGPGVIVIAGTGSIAYGRDFSGKTARAGGWGFAISDEGSAHWIGRTAVHEALLARDAGASAPALLDALMQVRRERSIDEFVRTVNSDPDFAIFFPAITQRANAGDSIAQKVLTRAGIELADLAGIVIRNLFDRDSAAPLALVGGVFRYAPAVRDAFGSEVQSLHPGIVLSSEVVDPVFGALQIARRPR